MKTIKTKPQGVFLQITLTGRTHGWEGWMDGWLAEWIDVFGCIAWLIAKNAMPPTNR